MERGRSKAGWGVGEDEKREFNGVMVVDGSGGRRWKAVELGVGNGRCTAKILLNKLRDMVSFQNDTGMDLISLALLFWIWFPKWTWFRSQCGCMKPSVSTKRTVSKICAWDGWWGEVASSFIFTCTLNQTKVIMDYYVMTQVQNISFRPPQAISLSLFFPIQSLYLSPNSAALPFQWFIKQVIIPYEVAWVCMLLTYWWIWDLIKEENMKQHECCICFLTNKIYFFYFFL